MWYYTRPGDSGHITAPNGPSTVAAFIEQNLLEEVGNEEQDTKILRLYRITERGKAYMRAVLNVPLPVQKWVMPEPKAWADHCSDIAE